jgi:hypothetical protein
VASWRPSEESDQLRQNLPIGQARQGLGNMVGIAHIVQSGFSCKAKLG